MFVNTFNQVGSNANIQCPVALIGENIDCGLFVGWHKIIVMDTGLRRYDGLTPTL